MTKLLFIFCNVSIWILDGMIWLWDKLFWDEAKAQKKVDDSPISKPKDLNYYYANLHVEV
jgi:hypothetical protein